MRILTRHVFVLAMGGLVGCATHEVDSLGRRTRITYYDRNSDGKVDLEEHGYPGVADADWILRDDDYDGKFEKKIRYGIAVKETVVAIRVPKEVKIEAKP